MNTRIAFVLVLLVASAVLGRIASAQQAVPTRETLATLTVRGSAEIDKPADELRLDVGVVTEASDAQTALRNNSERMKQVVEAIKAVGLTEKEYETGRFQVQPRYSTRPPRGDAEWRQQIVGYAVTNTVRIKTQKLDLAGRLIEAANKAGANTIDSIIFGLANSRTHRAEAIREATANAMADANALASAAELRLVRVISITLDEGDRFAPPMMYGRAVAMGMDMESAPPIQPGEVTVRASVAIVYEIASLH